MELEYTNICILHNAQKMKEIYCCRCGNKVNISFKNLSEYCICSHCHLTMKIDTSTSRRLKYIRIMMVLPVVAFLFLGMKSVEKGNYILLICALGLAGILALYIDRICLWLTGSIYGLVYEEYKNIEKNLRGKK